eukprot:TRINITY_DN3171_c0_g1_i1.p1 TRINITY_DN3171_c0_g1~~TRINITY_DN3171_c0_g1_i1.p1  ORF type:complete len:1084 (+),score=209.97 TRINITY_DN3171_c0_g1_i1:101-3352(+)
MAAKALSTVAATKVSFDVRPLEGITVVEFGTYLIGPLVGLHLRHLGARVIAITRPRSARGAAEEASWRPATVAALQEGKQIMELDLHSEADASTARTLILQHADVVVENFSPGACERLGLSANILRKMKPSLIHLALPGFASSDPVLASLPAWEAVILAVSGVFRDMGVNRQLMGIPASYSPLPLASAYGSVLGALSVVTAIYRRNVAIQAGSDPELAPGESIEVPLASALLDTLVHNSLDFECPDRYASARQRHLNKVATGSAAGKQLHYEEVEELMDPFYNHYRCADGRPFYLVAPAHIRHQQNSLKVLGLEAEAVKLGVPMASPYSSEDSKAHGLGAGQTGDAHAAKLRRAMKRAFLARTAFEWESLMGAAGVPGAAHRTTVEWLQSPHARDAGLAVASEDGSVRPGPAVWIREELVLNDSPCSPKSTSAKPKAAVAERGSETKGCLAGIRVLDLANVIAGPTIGSYLARFGAEVIHVAPPAPLYSPEITVIYGIAANMGKRSILLNVKDAEGRKAFEKLVAESDLVVMNCTAACLERLGCSAEELKRMNPSAILVRFDAWGGPLEAGERAEHLGYDDNLQAALGIMTRFGGGMGRVEEHAHIGTIDVVAGIGGALAAAGALVQRLKGPCRGTLVARASLASLGQIVQFPFCCGQPEKLKAEANACATRDGPECRGEHALLRCYETGRGEWLLLAGSLQRPLSAEEASIQRLACASPLLREAVASAGAGSSGGAFDARLCSQLSDVFLQTGLSADEWSKQLLEGGIAAVKLRSLSQVRTASLNESSELLSGPTFQFYTDHRHPIGGAVTMFSPCSVRTSSSAVRLPLSPAPRYGQHTREILQDIGCNAEALIACGAASESWSKEYLPGYKPQQPRQIPTHGYSKLLKTSTCPRNLDMCPICLQAVSQVSSLMELSCGHILCTSCAANCSSSGHSRCPVCRHPHLLDPVRLQRRTDRFRQAYGNWRLGEASGATGEVSDTSAPISPHRSKWVHETNWAMTAGDLFLANSELCKEFEHQEETTPKRLKMVMTEAVASLADLDTQDTMQKEQCEPSVRNRHGRHHTTPIHVGLSELDIDDACA